MDEIGEPRITEIEPGLWELRITHGDHEHAIRATDGTVFINDKEEPETAVAALERCARVTLRFLAEGRMDCQQPTPRHLRDTANGPWGD